MSKSQEPNDIGRIPYEVLMRIFKRFKDKKRKHLKDHYEKEETKSIWFINDNEFKAFLREFLDEKKEISGMRVYICQHDERSVPPDVDDPKEYVDRITVGFVPTKYDKETQKHEDHPDARENKLPIVVPYDQGKICPPDICPTERT